MNRREFLKSASLIPALTLLPLGNLGWAARITGAAYSHKRLIVIFLRGAVDGLNVVIPYNEPAYYDGRPTIAISAAGDDDHAFADLDGQFGMHPALANLLPLWRERSLAFVHACGSPDATRSHFDAQDYMESGTPGTKTTPDGWMNRLLAALPGPHTPTQAVSFGPTLPRIFAGKITVANLTVGKNVAQPMPLDRPAISDAFDRLYRGSDPLSHAYQEGQRARKRLVADLAQEMEAARNGAPPASGFTQIADHAARLMARDKNIRLVFLAVGGWDTHVNQGAATGQLANHLRPLGDGLANLAHNLGSAYGDTTTIVISEFGRTVRENGNGGTDHGHGNVMWLMGGDIHGGKVYGKWPGLATENLYEGRDLAVTTDFREVISSVLARDLNLTEQQLAAVFPGFRMAPSTLPIV